MVELPFAWRAVQRRQKVRIPYFNAPPRAVPRRGRALPPCSRITARSPEHCFHRGRRDRLVENRNCRFAAHRRNQPVLFLRPPVALGG